MTLPNWPQTIYEADPFTDPNDTSLPAPSYLDITKRVIGSWKYSAGRNYALGKSETATWTPTLRNHDGLFDVDDVDNDLCAGILPTFSGGAVVSGNPAWITGGYTDGSKVVTVGTAGTPVSCTVDLGSVRWLGSIFALQDFVGGARYGSTSNTFQISVDGVTWTTVRDLAVVGSNDDASSSGILVPFPPQQARYVRQTINSITGSKATWVALQAFVPSWRLFRRFRMRKALSPNQNLCPLDVATAGAQNLTTYPVGSVLPASSQALAISDVGAVTLSADSPIAGSGSYSVPVPSGTPVSYRILATQPTLPVTPDPSGLHYTASFYARCAPGQPNLVVQAAIRWYGPNYYPGQVWGGSRSPYLFEVSTSSVTLTNASWTRITVSGPATAVVGMRADMALYVFTSPGSNTVVEVGGLQWEQASSASAYAQPGQDFPVFTGQAERMPRSYALDGVMGVVKPPIIDVLGVLSSCPLDSVIDSEFLADGPVAYYPLTDPQGSVSAQNMAVNSPVGNAIGFGSKKEPAGTTYALPVFGDTQMQDLVDNPNCMFIDYDTVKGLSPGLAIDTALTLSPTGGWTIAVWCWLDPTHGGVVFSQAPAYSTAELDLVGPTPSILLGGSGAGAGAKWLISATNGAASGALGVGVQSPANIDYTVMHLLVGRLSADAKTTDLFVDGVLVATATGSPVPAPVVPQRMTLGARMDAGGNVAADLARAWLKSLAIYTYPVADARIASWYHAGFDGFNGESSGSRYARILGYSGVTVPTALDTGQSLMGPAVGLASLDGQTALEDVITTENGMHFTAPDGTLVFKSRTSRYQQTAPLWTLGESDMPVSSEFNLDYDPTQMANQVEIDQAKTDKSGNSVAAFAQDSTSVRRFFPRSFTRTVNTSTLAEQSDAAAYFLEIGRKPGTRLQRVILSPGQHPAAWPIALGIRLNDRSLAYKTPIGQVRKFVDGFIEKLTWTEDANGPKANLELVISNGARDALHMLCGAERTTAAVLNHAGDTTIVCNSLPDAGVNPAAANLPVGAVWVYSPGLAAQELVTLASFDSNAYAVPAVLAAGISSGATSVALAGGTGAWTGLCTIGYPGSATVETVTVSSFSGGTAHFGATAHAHLAGEPFYFARFTVTLGAALVNAHPVGAVLSEQLPSGVTDPAKYDAYSLLDSPVRLAY